MKTDAERFADVMAEHYGKITGLPVEVDAVPDGVCVHTDSRDAASQLARKLVGRLRINGKRIEISHAPMRDEDQPPHAQWWFACFFAWHDVV